jgi:hypothetical protein
MPQPFDLPYSTLEPSHLHLQSKGTFHPYSKHNTIEHHNNFLHHTLAFGLKNQKFEDNLYMVKRENEFSTERYI